MRVSQWGAEPAGRSQQGGDVAGRIDERLEPPLAQGAGRAGPVVGVEGVQVAGDAADDAEPFGLAS